MLLPDGADVSALPASKARVFVVFDSATVFGVWVDLLKSIDPTQGAIGGTWKLENRRLLTPFDTREEGTISNGTGPVRTLFGVWPVLEDGTTRSLRLVGASRAAFCWTEARCARQIPFCRKIAARAGD